MIIASRVGGTIDKYKSRLLDSLNASKYRIHLIKLMCTANVFNNCILV